MLVPIGISLATTKGCSDCNRSFVGLFADFVESELGRPVDVESSVLNSTMHPEQPIETEKLLLDLQEWDAMREAISQADIVVIVIGYDDTPWNRFDDPCGVAPDFPIVEWSGLTNDCMTKVAEDHRRFLDGVLAEIDELRDGQATAVRVVTVYNSTIGNTVDPSWDSPDAIEPTVFANDLFVRVECEVASDHGAECVDVYHRINGSDGRLPARDFLAPDYTHLNQHGHEAVAAVLADIGLTPLQATRGESLVEVDLSPGAGTYLVDADWFTLYVHTTDAQGPSTCYDDCAATWLPLIGPASAGEAVDAEKLGTLARNDGSLQVTYNGWPLYRFSGDPEPLSQNGRGLEGTWWLIGGQGEPCTGTPTAAEVPGSPMSCVVAP